MYTSTSDTVVANRTLSGQKAGIGAKSMPAPVAISFGRFVALPRTRSLLKEDVPLCLGGRAFDLLMVLLRARGEVVTKEQIIRYVWPTTTVDESNLRFQMAVLRKVLAQDGDLIKTVHGRGYFFAGNIAIDEIDDVGRAACYRAIIPQSHVETFKQIQKPCNGNPEVEDKRLSLDALCGLLRLLHVDAEDLALARSMLAGDARAHHF